MAGTAVVVSASQQPAFAPGELWDAAVVGRRCYKGKSAGQMYKAVCDVWLRLILSLSLPACVGMGKYNSG